MPSDASFRRTLDLGCGFALTLFIINKTDVDYVYNRTFVYRNFLYKQKGSKARQYLLVWSLLAALLYL